jgi:hypothetical protein
VKKKSAQRILLWEQNSRGAAIRLGHHPDLDGAVERIGAGDAKLLLHGAIVLLPSLTANIAPIPGDMALQEHEARDTGGDQRVACLSGGYNFSGWETRKAAHTQGIWQRV